MGKNWIGLIDTISKGGAVVAAVLAGLAAVHIVIDALARTLARQPLPATLEITQYFWMPALISMTLGYTLYRREHIRVDLLTSAAGSRVRRVAELVAMVFTFAIVALTAWASIEAAVNSAGNGEHSDGTSWVILAPGRILIAVGLVILALQSIAQIARALHDELPRTEEEEILVLVEAEAGELRQAAHSLQDSEETSRFQR